MTVPHKSKSLTSKRAWSPSQWSQNRDGCLGLKSLGLSLSGSLPALPSPFPSPAAKTREKNVGFGQFSPIKSRKEMWSHGASAAKRQGVPSLGNGMPGPVHRLQSAAFLAGAVDWIGSKTSKVRCLSPVSPYRRRKSRSLHPKGKSALQKAGVTELRHELNLPKDAMLQALDLFQKHAKSTTGDTPVKERRLTEAGFVNVWSEMTGKCDQAESDVPPKILAEAFRDAAQSRELEFSQFAVWFSSRWFCEDVSLDKESKEIRSMARRHAMHHTKVENYKQLFNRFDKDGNGTIDSNEFEELLCTCTKVPSSIGLSASRLKQLWQNADKDGDEEIDFEEFLTFYTRYLGEDSTGFEDYYKFGARQVAPECHVKLCA